MSVNRGARNNLLAGVFVLAAIALAVVCVVLLTGIADRFTLKSRYIVRFGAVDGADGLDAGSPVKVAGQRVGQVEKWMFVPDANGEPSAIDVVIAIRRDIKLYDDADATLIKPLLGGQSMVNIVPNPGQFAVTTIAGPPREVVPDLLDRPALRGRLGGPGFLAPSDYARLRGVLTNFEEITSEFRNQGPALLGDARKALESVQKAVDEAQGMIADARPLVQDVRQRWPAWGDNVSSVLARIEREVRDAEGIAKRVSDGVQEVRDFVQQGRDVLAENRPRVKQLVEDTQAMIERFRKQEYETLAKTLEDARATMGEARTAAEQVAQMVASKRPELEEIVTSANLSAQQLKLAVGEIRASPWRLLYQPTKKELENELLYNAVRQYANSVSELRVAADALRSASDRAAAGGRAAPDAGVLNDLTQKLQSAFAQYQEQERVFVERWVGSAGGK